jgi:hypothetical protein
MVTAPVGRADGARLRRRITVSFARTLGSRVRSPLLALLPRFTRQLGQPEVDDVVVAGHPASERAASVALKSRSVTVSSPGALTAWSTTAPTITAAAATLAEIHHARW